MLSLKVSVAQTPLFLASVVDGHVNHDHRLQLGKFLTKIPLAMVPNCRNESQLIDEELIVIEKNWLRIEEDESLCKLSKRPKMGPWSIREMSHEKRLRSSRKEATE